MRSKLTSEVRDNIHKLKVSWSRLCSLLPRLMSLSLHNTVSPCLSYHYRHDRECFNWFVTFPASNLCGPIYSYCPEGLLFWGLVDFLSHQICHILALPHRTHIRTYVCMNECMYVWCMYVSMCVCVCMYVCMYVCIYECMYACAYVCMCICM